MPRKIEVSHKTIVFTVLFLILLWFLYSVRDLILGMFVALLIMAILNPMVTKLSKWKIPRGISVLVTYFVVFGLLGVAVSNIAPALIEQTTNFVNGLPGYIDNLSIPQYLKNQVTGETLAQIGSVPTQIARTTVSLLSNVFGVITVLVFAFYLLLARDKLDEQLGFLFGDKKKAEIRKTINLLEKRLGGWARGQIYLMVLIGVTMYIGLRILGIPYALPLAILAGILEVVPYIGPIVAAILLMSCQLQWGHK